MAASAFAAVSQTNGFHESHDDDQDAQSQGQADQESLDKDTRSSQEQPAAQDELTAAESAQAEQQTAQHEQHQAQSPDAGADAGAKTAQTGVKAPHSGIAGSSKATEASESEPLTETSLRALRLSTDASQSQPEAIPTSASGPDQDSTAGSPAAPASQGSDFAGSATGSHTFDAELHEGMAALVQAPEQTDTADQQPTQAISSSEVDLADESVQALTTGPSSPESTSSQQGAEAEAAAAANQAHVYSLGSDEEEDLTVVSSKDQAREAQVSTCCQSVTVCDCSSHWQLFLR